MASDEEGGLRLPKNVGVPIPRTPVQKQIHASWETFDAVQEELRQRGFPDGPQPATGAFPNLTTEDLTNVNSQEFSSRYAEFLSWWRYTSETFAGIKGLMLQVKNELDDLEVEVKRGAKENEIQGAKKVSAEGLKLSFDILPRTKELKLLLQRAEQSKLLIEIRLEYLERSLRVISRQVEIRKLDIEQGKVEHAMPMRGQPYPNLRAPEQGKGGIFSGKKL